MLPRQANTLHQLKRMYPIMCDHSMWEFNDSRGLLSFLCPGEARLNKTNDTKCVEAHAISFGGPFAN